DYTQSASMARAMADAGADLLFEEYVTAYGPAFLDLAGSASEGAVSWIRSLPNEEAGSNAEQDLFLEWMAQTAPDAQPDTFAADSWVAAKAMVEALEALPGPITRDAVLAQLRSLTSFDAGGMFGTIDLGGKRNNGCLIAMRVQGGAWTRIAPGQGFLC
ncbi:MAG TPA: ABC transporter substrate-binding protein, partial [Acidimicrobiales bacterium]|nr:ABC transporter substrate-binding protein [Acidimicrobiales bacterium]